MNRRQFLKAGLSLILAACAPRVQIEKIEGEKSMTRIGDRLESILKLLDDQMQSLARTAGARVEPVFQSGAALDLIRELNWLGEREDIYKSWLTPGSKDPSFNTMHARRVDLETPPGNPYMVYWLDLDVPDMFDTLNTTWTALDLTDDRLTIKQDSPCVVRLDGTKIYPSNPDAFIQFLGRVSFYPNSTGHRYVAIAYYTSADVLIERRTLSGEAAMATAAVTDLPFASFRPSNIIISTDPDQYFQIEVYQSSGGNLGVVSIELALSLSYK